MGKELQNFQELQKFEDEEEKNKTLEWKKAWKVEKSCVLVSNQIYASFNNVLHLGSNKIGNTIKN